MENNKSIIETLNDLVQINNDRIKGFENAIKELSEKNDELYDRTDLVNVFNNKILESRQLKSTLVQEIQVLGGEAETDSTVSGAIHRTWLEVKAAFSGHSEKSILEECEFGEDAIKKAYQTAIDDEDTPAYIRDILNDQKMIIDQSHDEIKALRDSVEQHH
jgi:uncharacterized protein (TIGR02284 family)